MGNFISIKIDLSGNNNLSLGGRILTKNTTIPAGQMASARSKYLVCHYCNKKSKIKYDGLITSWECKQCESTNFLDENGEITDPPVATLDASPPDLKYSVSRTGSPPVSQTSQTYPAFSQGYQPFDPPPKSSPFCAACLEQQRLHLESRRQYEVALELDPSHPDHRQLRLAMTQFLKNLDIRYPQVCEDCAPNVNKIMNAANKIGEADHIRRLLVKSKLRVNKAARRITVDGTFTFLGRFLWYIGLLAQLLWGIIALSAIADHHMKMAADSSYPAFVAGLISTVSEASRLLPQGSSLSLGYYGLLCSCFAVWWNPRFHELNRGFRRHISGYNSWYKHQGMLLVIRGLFYFVMSEEQFANSLQSAVGAAHLFTFVFVAFLAIRAHSSIKVDYSRLHPASSQLKHVGPGSSLKQTEESMADTIKHLRVGTRLNRPAPTTSNASYKPRFRPEPYIQGTIRSKECHTGPLKSMTEVHVTPRPTPPMFANFSNERQTPHPSLQQQYAGLKLGETYVDQDMSGNMDWSPAPSQPKSQHRAFTENLPVDKNAVFLGQAQPQQKTKLFGETPVDPKQTFWYKGLPPAPITPAHRLRNPPNQPRMRTVSHEQKQNFFNNSKNNTSMQENLDSATSGNRTRRTEVEFAERKFFAPEPPSPGHDDLVSALDGWSLKDSIIPQVVMEKNKYSIRHMGQAIALSLALVFWHQTLNNPSGYTKYIVLAVLLGCLCIGMRTVLDNTYFVEAGRQRSIDNALSYTIGILVGSAECMAACFGLSWLSQGYEYEACGTLGTVLTGGMLVHELWLLLF